MMVQGLEQIRKAVRSTTGRADIDVIRAQVDRVREELSGLSELLGGAAQESLSRSEIARRAEALTARATSQLSAGAARANETVRAHPMTGLAVVLGIGLIAALLSRR